MAVTTVQINLGQNGLNQTFNAVFVSGPIQDNLLVALLWHDEIGSDIADISSAGWTRMNTFGHALEVAAPDWRISIWAKFAGASESSTIAVDLGEINRRAHLWIVEFSGQGFTELPAEDTATMVSHANVTGGETNQVDAALDVPAGLLAMAMVGMVNTITDPSVSWDGDMVTDADASANFRGSAFGHLDGADNEQPTVTWTGARANAQMFVLLGVGVPPSIILEGSSFRVSPSS